MRKFYLDELPQLFNIIRGDMVVVGPRPNPSPHYWDIRRAGFCSKVVQRSGLTGGVQTAKGTARHGDLTLDEDYLHFCLDHDLPQIVRRDLETIWKTVRTVLRAEGL